jgi:hypothetical protein
MLCQYGIDCLKDIVTVPKKFFAERVWSSYVFVTQNAINGNQLQRRTEDLFIIIAYLKRHLCSQNTLGQTLHFASMSSA